MHAVHTALVHYIPARHYNYFVHKWTDTFLVGKYPTVHDISATVGKPSERMTRAFGQSCLEARSSKL